MKSATQFKIITAAILITAVIVLTAGCIVDTGDHSGYPAAGGNMNKVLDSYILELRNYASSHDTLLLASADNLKAYDANSADARGVLRYLYSDLKDAVAVVYYDENFNTIIQVPWTTTLFKADLIPVTDENKDRIVTHGPYDNEWFGSVFAVSAPVYDLNGKYKGRVGAFFRSNTLISIGINELPEITGYAMFVTSPDGTILASSHKYEIGTSYYDKETLDILKTSKDSGTLYTTVFNSITRKSVPMTALWKKENIHNEDMIIGLGVFDDDTNLNDYLDESADIESLTAYVNGIHEYALSHTKSETLAYISGLSGVSPVSIYPAFAIEYDGNVLAMAGYPEYVGKNINCLEDSYGIQHFKSMKLRALDGGGYVDFQMDTCLEAVTDKAVLNLAYVLPVGSDYYVGATIPSLDSVSKVNQGIITDLYSRMSEILRYFYDNKRDSTISAVNDGKFSDDSIVVTGISYAGDCLCQSPKIMTSTSNVFDIKDNHGNNVILDTSLLAKRGGGFMYYCLPKENGVSELYICIVQPLEGDWFIAAAKVAETGRGI